MFPLVLSTAYSSSYATGKIMGAAVLALLIGYRLYRLFVRGRRIHSHYAGPDAVAVAAPGYLPPPVAAPDYLAPPVAAPGYAPSGTSVAPPGFVAPRAPVQASPAAFATPALGAPAGPARRRAPVGDMVWFAVIAIALLFAVVRFGGYVGLDIGKSYDYAGLPPALHTHKAVTERAGFIAGCQRVGVLSKDACRCFFNQIVAQPQFATPAGLDTLPAATEQWSAGEPPLWVRSAALACRNAPPTS